MIKENNKMITTSDSLFYMFSFVERVLQIVCVVLGSSTSDRTSRITAAGLAALQVLERGHQVSD